MQHPDLEDPGKEASFAGTDDLLPTQDVENIRPLDEHNLRLLAHVCPMGWTNPQRSPEERPYTLVVLGAGAGGLVSAAGASGIGAKVAIIEQHLMGGDCLNYGCVPSKALLRAAKSAKSVQRAVQELGGRDDPESLGDLQRHAFCKAMTDMRRIRADLSVNDSAIRFRDDLNVDVYQGRACFVSPTSVQIVRSSTSEKSIIHFKKAVVATGATAAVPEDLRGLSSVSYLVNTTVFNLTELPPRVGIIGAGPIGCELAQAFARFGSKVMMFVRGVKILPKEDRDAAKVVLEQLLEDQVDIQLRSTIVELRETRAGSKYHAPFPQLEIEYSIDGKFDDGPLRTFECDALIVATGRSPNVEKIGLDKAQVQFDTTTGVHINDFMQTTNKNIYAVGDVCVPSKFTHVADFMARSVIRNALFFGQSRYSRLVIPWTTFTEPEIAHVGSSEHDLVRQNIPHDSYTKSFVDNDRAICDRDTRGFVKIHVQKGSDVILGATIVNANAGNMISEITMAMHQGIGLGTIANIIHPYPTQSDAIRACGDLYNRTKLTPCVKALLTRVAQRSLNPKT